jgi:hypothetical protein
MSRLGHDCSNTTMLTVADQGRDNLSRPAAKQIHPPLDVGAGFRNVGDAASGAVDNPVRRNQPV